MARFLGVVAIGLALVAVGCGPVGVLESGGSAHTVAALPGGVELAGDASTEYPFEATLGYRMRSDESDDEGSFIGLGFTWYFMEAVTNDDVPIGLQPVAQKSSELSLDIAFGSMEWDLGADDSDVFEWTLYAKYIMGEDMVDGLGFELSYGQQSVEEPNGSADDQDTTNWRFGALYYIPQVEGLIAKLGYSNTNVDSGTTETDLGGIDIGAQYYTEVTDGQYIDVELTLAMLDLENGTDDDAFQWALRFDYYPMKVLGLGVTYTSTGYDDLDDTMDESDLEIHVSFSFDEAGVPGLDLNLSYLAQDFEADE